MNVHLVVWVMVEDKPDYGSAWAAFVAHLDRYESVGDPDLESIRFVATDLSAGQVSADLHAKLGPGDKLIVAQVMEGTYCGWLSQDVWNWTEARVVGRSQPPPGAPEVEGYGPSDP
ncbi:MAG TPA: hypothetical protein VE053_05110 [Allosphingosinicella sp.]|nr:hypothetical protein [Allosphingosinicella sp.]